MMNLRILFVTVLLPFSFLWGEEQVLRKTPVPNRFLRQGEVLLLRNGDQVEVRIDLHTKHLKKIQQKIQESEKVNWPDSPDSLLYIQNLNQTCKDAIATGKGKVSFVIKWILNPDGSGRVSLITETDIIDLETLSQWYVKRNMVLILADNFDVTEAEALQWIQEARAFKEHP